VFAFPSVAEGFGLPVIEAFSLGTPVVHSDAAALVEVSAGAGLSVASAVADEYPDRLAATITRVVEDEGLARRLGFSGLDRAAAFSWTDAARQVWQLHADL
jgi:glycosyltransferase involved in cell wall biosynthesis